MISTASANHVGPRSPTGKRQGRSTRQEAIRGQPKKKGHGGWGKVGEEGDGEYYALTLDDPNFDIEDEEEPPEFVGRRRTSSSVTYEVLTPRISPHDLEDSFTMLLCAYMENGDTLDFINSTKRLQLSDSNMDEILVYAVNLSFDRRDRERELCSKLLSELHASHLLNEESVSKGFNTLLCRIEDITLDCPKAPEMLPKFIARAVADDCLAPTFLQQKDGLGSVAKNVLHQALNLITSPHGLVRLDTTWGVGGGNKPIKLLVKKMQLLLKEYLGSKEVAEAERCLMELEVPHFHHEVVYQLVQCALEEVRNHTTLVTLLEHMAKTNIVTPQLMEMGFRRIFADIKDIQLDVPLAFVNLDAFVWRAFSRGCIDKATYMACPHFPRKRYASQGDGGQIKQ